MSLWRQLSRGLRALVGSGKRDEDLKDEVQHYLDQATAANVARGLSPSAARRAAQIEIGNATAVREQVRSAGWENTVEAFVADMRYGLRRLRTSPGFALVSVLTLALGIGATTAIFSVLNPILLASLPYPAADRLVTIGDRADDGSQLAPTYGTYVELRARARTFTNMAAMDHWQPSLTGTDQPERLEGERVTASYFVTLGVRPLVGRDFLETDEAPGGPRVVIMSDRLLQRRFGGDRSLVGRAVHLDGDDYLVVGILPPHFTNVLAPSADIFSPLQERAHAPFNSREWGHHYRIVARLEANVDANRAERDLTQIGRAPSAQFARPNWADLSRGVAVRSLRDEVAADTKPALLAIAGAVVLLLAIGCVNVTNLLLARGSQRRAEFAMRVALGAGRSRLLRQLLTESLMLALIGGACGIVVAKIGVRALLALSPPGLPRLEAIDVNGAVLAFALVTSTVIGLIVGLVPALGAARQGLSERLHSGSRRTAGRQGAARRILVIAEVSLALVLLVGAGLLMRSLEHVLAVAPGFASSRLLTMQIIDAGHAYPSDTAKRVYYQRVVDAVRAVPGVTAAAFTSQLPLSGDLDSYGYEIAARPSANPGDAGSALRYEVTSGYLKAMGIPLLRGRALESVDLGAVPQPVLINESFARRTFGNADPIGQRVRFGPEVGSNHAWDIVVGVVGDVKQESLVSPQRDAFYTLAGNWWWVDNVQSLVVRTTGDPALLAPSVKRAVWSVNAHEPIARTVTMDDLIALTTGQRRFTLIIIETFAFSALVLAAIGIYGVLSGSVSERMREIGVRSALGASRQSILTLIVRQGLGLTLIGVVLGLSGAALATRGIMSLMFGVSLLDPVTYAGVVMLLLFVATVACWLPAWRAARVDPAITLRAE
jgi:putative ABC transport system permease protein